MTGGLRLGRVRGIEIEAHWTLLLVAALIVWSLADGVFPETNPGLSDGTYLAMASVAAVLFFASILLHELGHAFQAQRDGVGIDGITLWVFGGVARLSGQMPSAGAEFRIALAGPVVSLVLGVAFAAAALGLSLPAEVDGVAFWIGQMNLYLLVFNLIPALPLDGGRVLRAALWAWRGDFGKATRITAALGRGFGRVLIGGGLALAILVGDFGGLWVAFIGWFLLSAAEGELLAAQAQEALGGLTVDNLMVRRPVAVDADASVEEFINRVFLPTRHTAFPVVEGDRPAGIVSFRKALDVPRSDWPWTAVREIAVDGPELRVRPDTPLADVLPRLSDGDPRRLLVVENGTLRGLLSPTDVMRAMEVLTVSRAAGPLESRWEAGRARHRARPL